MACKAKGGAGPGLENAVYDAHKNVLWTPDRLVATALDGQDGQYDGKFFGAKIKVMRQKDGVPAMVGHWEAAETARLRVAVPHRIWMHFFCTCPLEPPIRPAGYC